jgi:hypothetical protein
MDLDTTTCACGRSLLTKGETVCRIHIYNHTRGQCCHEPVKRSGSRNDRKCHSPSGKMCEEGVPVFVPDVAVSPGLGDPTRGHCCHARKALARNDRNNRGLLDRPDPTQGGDRDEHDQHCQYSGQETTALTLVHHMQIREETFHFPVRRSEPGE